MQAEPKLISFFTLNFKMNLLYLSLSLNLCKYNLAGNFLLSKIPPTLPAALITISGLCF